MLLGSRVIRRLRWLAPLLALVVIAACSKDFPQTTLAPKGELARIEDDVFFATVKWAALVFVLVEGALIYAIFRFRGKPGDAEPDQIHGNTIVEVIWTVIPSLILVMIAVPTVKAIFRENETPKGGDVLTVEVIGHQWWWEFRYPKYGLVTANELHIPVGRTVELKQTSDDVIHSFWPPRFAGKRDVFPGRETRLWFKAETAGEYPGQCAEFCGLQHGRMSFRIKAQEPADFAAWVAHMQTRTAAAPAPDSAAADSVAADSAAVPTDSLYAAGEKLFTAKGCIGCHSIQAYPAPTGKGPVGPNLANVGARSWIAAGTLRNTDENLAKWIRNPQAIKQGVLMLNLGVTEPEARALVAFLRAHQ